MAVPMPLINGVRHSWSSIECRVAGNIILGGTEINYSPKQDNAYVKAAGALPVGQTLGNAEYEADYSLLLEEFNQLQIALGPGMMVVPFDIVVAYDASLGGVPTVGLSVIVDSLLGCRITAIEASNSSGSTDATVRKLTLRPTSILLNGLRVGPEQPTAAA